MKTTTWTDIKKLCKLNKHMGYYVSYDEWNGTQCLRCNNGYIQSRRPDYAGMIIRSTMV
jgi:hypothetical protein